MEKAKPIPPKDLIPGTRGTFKLARWRGMVEEWNKSYREGHRWRFDQSDNTAEKMFRRAFAYGYEAITGQKYYAAKPLTTKEEVREEGDNLREGFKKHGPPQVGKKQS